MRPAIQVETLSKKYCRSVGRTARYAATDLLRAMFRRPAEAALRRDEFWALRDLSFQLEAGQCLGVIGANGAGKSTLLKLVSGIIEPDQGRIEVRGRVGSLIELGAGFHPQLTGRENVYVNGAILGMNRREMNARFEEIVAFAELGDFLETPVRFYSSGMTVRLGFSVAIHTEPDVLLVDEVLSVGDLEFQARCLKRIEALRQAGTTFLFVSHDLSKVGRLCPQTLVLSHGKAAFLGDTGEAIDVYRESAFADGQPSEGRRLASREVEITGVEFLDRDSQAADSFAVGEPLVIRVHFYVRQPIDEAPLTVAIYRAGDLVHAADFRSEVDGFPCGPFEPGAHSIELAIPACNLLPGTYVVSVVLWQPGSLAPYAWNLYGYRFSISGGSEVTGVCHLPHEWRRNGEPQRG